MKPEETFDYPIRWAWHSIQRQYQSIATTNDLTMTMGYVLLNIDVEIGTPSTQLGPKIGMEASSLTRTLKSMEEKGYIHKQTNDDDRRKVRICLTEKGLEKREISKAAVIHFNEILAAELTASQRTSFFEVMEMINNTLSNENIFEDISTYEAKN